MNPPPIPFPNAKLPPTEFPLKALRDFPIFGRAVVAGKFLVKSPEALNYQAALTALSIVIQSRCRVRSPVGLIHSTNLYMAAIGDGGERKSATDDFYNARIRKIVSQQATDAAERVSRYEFNLRVWSARVEKAKKKSLLVAEDAMALEKAFAEEREIERAMPILEPIFDPFLGDTTLPAVKQAFAERIPSLAFLSNEGMTLFETKVLDQLGFINQLWQARDIDVSRMKKKDSFVVKSPLLTLSIFIQMQPLMRQTRRRGNLFRQIGFASRLLWSCPESTMGGRLFSVIPDAVLEMEEFHKRIEEILKEPLKEPVVVGLSVEATALFEEYFNDVERNLGKGGYLEDIKDAASKIAENLLRLAAVIHYFEKFSGPISAETLKGAIELCNYHLYEFKRLFGEADESSMEVDANDLAAAISRICARRPGLLLCNKDYLRVRANSPCRQVKRLDLVLAKLEDIDWIRRGRMDGREVVFFNSRYLPNAGTDPSWQISAMGLTGGRPGMFTTCI